MSGTDDDTDADFMARRDAARARLDLLFGSKGGDGDARASWFEAVYEQAAGDPAAVPWADLKPKAALCDWLTTHPGNGKRAVDIACGLGDNAEAIAASGYVTTAFDLSKGAIEWARRRFPESKVDYRQADLFDLPTEWHRSFDLVHECYTVQALHGQLRNQAFAAIAELVTPGGTLLVITRVREEGEEVNGPPWPLEPSELSRFEAAGLGLVAEKAYDVSRADRVIPHKMLEFRRPE
ncbi:class I SAM-dependent methyltransferase [Stappia sp. F7233]|uniref:Class I SAM-dependent methyltransferase n=1 Tax=Stappia albiluteola TaxID=2758565 RepID=A0A839ACK3_9HYPH|nr:class I SAM-dependent methyltransferase [Stappia albiluteola]MBA5776714.1 class I SAM-dependent methyltransferase [Stappia albiluteola]